MTLTFVIKGHQYLRQIFQVEQVRQLERELENFDAGLMNKPRWLVFTKADLLPAGDAARKAEEAVEALAWEGPWMLISSVTKSGTDELMQKVSAELELLQDEEAAAAGAAEPELQPDSYPEHWTEKQAEDQ